MFAPVDPAGSAGDRFSGGRISPPFPRLAGRSSYGIMKPVERADKSSKIKEGGS